MLILRHPDGFDGLLCAVHELYAQRWPRDAVQFCPQSSPVQALWGTVHEIALNMAHAERVGRRLWMLLGREGMHTLLLASLAAHADVWQVLGTVVCACLDRQANALLHYADAAAMQISQWQQAVHMERHRIKAFVRFEAMLLPDAQTVDGGQVPLLVHAPEVAAAPRRQTSRDRGLDVSPDLHARTVYVARIEPVHDVLPLVAMFFARRFADQRWLIVDVGRGYGVHFDRKTLHLVDDVNDALLSQPAQFHRSDEAGWQMLWRQYLQSATIASRANPRLQRRHMPLRYWKHLTEHQLERAQSRFAG